LYCFVVSNVVCTLDTKYQKFLQEVVSLRGDENPEEVEKLISRFTVLKNHNKKLGNFKVKMEKTVQEHRDALKVFKDEKMAEIITYNNMTSEYTRSYDSKQNHTTEAQKTYETVVKNSSDNKVVLGQIDMASRNLFQLVLNSKLYPRLAKFADGKIEIDEMLKSIGECLHDLKSISEKDRPVLKQSTTTQIIRQKAEALVGTSATS